MTSKDAIDRDAAQAIAECLRHGGSDADVRALRQQFQSLADDVDAEVTDKKIPN